MEENLYFAYGSNLDLEQMAQRCPDAEIVGPVRLENYELRFRGSGFATVAPKKGGRSRQTVNSLWIGTRGIPATTRKKP